MQWTRPGWRLLAALLLWASLPLPGAAQGNPSYGMIYETDGLPWLFSGTNVLWNYNVSNASASAITKLTFTNFFSLTTNRLLESPTSWKIESLTLVGSNVWSFTLSAKSSIGYIQPGAVKNFDILTTYDPTNTTLLYGPRAGAVQIQAFPGDWFMPDCSGLVGPVGVMAAGSQLGVSGPGSTGAVVRLSGVPGAAWSLERAPTVTGAWTAVSSLLLSTNGTAQWTDTNPPPAAFHRALRTNTPVRVEIPFP